MRRYAQNTKVAVAKSRAEIEALLTRYGASRFAAMSEARRAVVMFEAEGRRVAFELPLPDRANFRLRRVRGRTVEASPDLQLKEWEQACRQRWRALTLVIKAKLEAVQAGITTFEKEFLAHIVMPNGATVGSWLQPRLAQAYESGKMPPILPAGGDA